MRLTWRWSWLVSLPVAMFFLVWGTATVTNYQDFWLRHDSYVNRGGLRKLMIYEYETLMRRIRLVGRGYGDSYKGEAPRVHLLISSNNEGKLNSNLPTSGRNYADGFLQYPGGEVRPVDLRYRGDFFWHWALDKKSWRVKTEKTAMWNNMRKFNLIVPKTKAMVSGDLSYWLARDMGLIAPDSDVVEVWVNGKPRGVHNQVEQLEELVLRKAGRMPGDLFAGEMIGREVYPGKPAQLFSFPGVWEKAALNNHFLVEEELGTKKANEAMFRLCELIQAPPSEEVYRQIRALVNYEAFGLFTAYRQLTQSAHYDNGHNWRLYYDPWRNRFEPVVWDPNAWQSSWLPSHPDGAFEVPFFCELDNVLAKDDQFRLASARALVAYLEGGAEERLLRHYDEKCASVAGAVRRDPDLALFFKVTEESKVGARMVWLRAAIRKLWGHYRDRHIHKAPVVALRILDGPAGEIHVRVGVGGYQPLESLGFEFDLPQMARPLAYVTVQRADGMREEVDVSGGVVLEGNTIRIVHPLLPGYHLEAREAAQLPKRKLYVPDVRTYDVRLVFGNENQEAFHTAVYRSVGGQTGNPIPAETLELTSVGEAYAVVLPHPLEETLHWSGNIRVTGQRTISDVVIMEPGTVLEMEPGASLIFENRVLARGTRDNPIVVRPAESGQEPWGVLALRGPGAARSIFEFCTMSGGSGWKRFLVEYSAMFSIHNVPNVIVTDCEFRDSKVVDDMVHAVYSKDLVFRNCLFERSLFDSLDIDISTGVVESCEFVDSGNDSLDLMTSTVVVVDTKIIGSQDKAFSVGEGSHVILKNCLVVDCLIGVQVKDGSSAFIVHSEFVGNGMALDAYKKNWRYNNGGRVDVHKCWLEKNGSAASADKNSFIFIGNSYYETPPKPSSRVVLGPRNRFGKVNKASRQAQQVGFFFARGGIDPVKPFMRTIWPFPNSMRRGVIGPVGRTLQTE